MAGILSSLRGGGELSLTNGENNPNGIYLPPWLIYIKQLVLKTVWRNHVTSKL